MRHPVLCGFLLAFSLILAQVFAFPVDLLAACSSAAGLIGGADISVRPLVLALGVAAGAMIASLPERLRRKGAEREKLSPGRCAACFAGGAASVIGCGLAGGGFSSLLLTGSITGTVSGAAFAVIVLLSGCLAAAVAEGRARE